MVELNKIMSKLLLEDDKKPVQKPQSDRQLFKILNPFSPGTDKYFYSDIETETLPDETKYVSW